MAVRTGGTGGVVDLAAWKRRREPSPGMFSDLRAGDFVCRNGEVGRVERYRSTAMGRDVFDVLWGDGRMSAASHVYLSPATREQAEAFGRPLDPEADGEGAGCPAP